MASITLNDLQESLDLNSSALANVLGGCYRRPRWAVGPPGETDAAVIIVTDATPVTTTAAATAAIDEGARLAELTPPTKYKGEVFGPPLFFIGASKPGARSTQGSSDPGKCHRSNRFKRRERFEPVVSARDHSVFYPFGDLKWFNGLVQLS